LIKVLERNGELKVEKEIKNKLYRIGSATIDRMLAATRKSYQLKGRSTTKPGTLLKNQISIRIFAGWDDKRPGFFEADPVASCGETVRGDYVNSLNLTDVATAWVGLEAIMGKSQYRTHKAVDRI